jgi:DNA repair exonuclease SbcCD ATPase subunit
MPGGMGSGSSDQSARIRQLEQLVQQYKSDLESTSRDSRDLEAQIASLESQIKSFEQTLQELQSANTTLDAEVNDLMRRVASGEYNPKAERVIELQNNPAGRIMAVRNSVLEDLRKENEALLRNGSGGGDGSVPRESWERLSKEKEDLEKAHAKRLMRLKEVSLVSLAWRAGFVCPLGGIGLAQSPPLPLLHLSSHCKPLQLVISTNFTTTLHYTTSITPSLLSMLRMLSKLLTD